MREAGGRPTRQRALQAPRAVSSCAGGASACVKQPPDDGAGEVGPESRTETGRTGRRGRAVADGLVDGLGRWRKEADRQAICKAAAAPDRTGHPSCAGTRRRQPPLPERRTREARLHRPTRARCWSRADAPPGCDDPAGPTRRPQHLHSASEASHARSSRATTKHRLRARRRGSHRRRRARTLSPPRSDRRAWGRIGHCEARSRLGRHRPVRAPDRAWTGGA
jgi:hypothetical protein